jgi:hypothetical protein
MKFSWKEQDFLGFQTTAKIIALALMRKKFIDFIYTPPPICAAFGHL